ncbi:hypothetical protein Q5H92_03770 [Hymenobacter sp. M29]|uniref:Uncharacterized protein n=1 Tax=Hymenobacter mellowenesis TaxID=3063995 RepID=A0ABT9A7G6_9BACT|nr:hypothetical protein [Hymenobacter sp. M29]MDO7845463.1 hypothetical protein [Hymenobacter sp. M29]
MANILWSALNMLVLLGIIYILFRAAGLVRRHMGWGAAVLFGLALLLMCSRRPTSPAGPSKNLISRAPKSGPVSNASAGHTIDLGGSNKLYLRAEYDSAGGTLTPNGLYAGVSGFMLGHDWEPALGLLQQQGTRLHYWTVLNHHWLLLGTSVFSNGREFEGLMKPDQPLR